MGWPNACSSPATGRVAAVFFDGTSGATGLRWSEDNGATWPAANATKLSLPEHPGEFPSCVLGPSDLWVMQGLTTDTPTTSHAPTLDKIWLAHSRNVMRYLALLVGVSLLVMSAPASAGRGDQRPPRLHEYLNLEARSQVRQAAGRDFRDKVAPQLSSGVTIQSVRLKSSDRTARPTKLFEVTVKHEQRLYQKTFAREFLGRGGVVFPAVWEVSGTSAWEQIAPKKK